MLSPPSKIEARLADGLKKFQLALVSTFITCLCCMGFFISCGAAPSVTNAPDESISSDDTTDDTADDTAVDVVPSGSIVGYAYLEDAEDHSGITVTVGDNTTTTASNGSYEIDSVAEGSHQVTYSYGLGCENTNSISGQANFTDGRSDKSGATVIFQYNPDCYVGQQITGVAVFDTQSTEVENVTLSRGVAARLSTTTNASGVFSFDDIPVGTYNGELPTMPTIGVGIYEQATGTYALAIATSGLADTDEIYHMRSYPMADFRNDPYYQNEHGIEIADSSITDLGEIVLYPQIFVLTTDAYYDDLPYSGLDFSENNDVSSGDSNADTYLSFSSSQISINGADNIQESSKTDMQSVTEAPTTGYGDLATVDITDEDSWGYYPDHYNRVYIAITKEGHYVKFKLLPSCNGSGDNGSFRCFDVLYSYQSDTSANFSY